jgi:IS1 family transposase
VKNVNYEYLADVENATSIELDIIPYCESELDEQWSFVQNKDNQRWLWLAVCHHTGVVIAFVFGKRTDDVFRELKTLLEPFGFRTFYTDHWGAYSRNLSASEHIQGKSNTQTIERKNLTLRTRIKRLARKTICFSKSELLHDIVIALAINFIEFSYFHFYIDKLF